MPPGRVFELPRADRSDLRRQCAATGIMLAISQNAVGSSTAHSGMRSISSRKFLIKKTMIIGQAQVLEVINV